LNETIVCGGRTFDPSDSEIAVYESDKVTDEMLRTPIPWITVMETGREVTDDFIKVPPGSRRREAGIAADQPDPRRIAVIYGRDSEASVWLFSFLRSLDLHPLEWTELVKATRSGAPSNRTVVEQLFEQATAVVVLLSPDEVCRLHPDLTPQPDARGEGAWRSQPRANVLLEAGMALAFHPDRTIFVEIGAVRMPSDLEGVNVVRLDGTAGPLHSLAERLHTSGCAVERRGTGWLSTDELARLQARTRLPATDGT
jgi:CAP12/Pycsar effector protein, TIR domain